MKLSTEEMKQRRRAKNRAYYFAHKPKLFAYIKRRYHTNPEVRRRAALRQKKYRATHRNERNALERQKRRDNPDWGRKRWLRDRYGLSLDNYNMLVTSQNGVCAICKNGNDHGTNVGRRTKHLTVDHCHKTGKIRGLLCHKCNAAIGYLQDSPTIVASALEYLHRFSAP